MPAPPEVIVPFATPRAQVMPMTQVRSTLLTTSLRAVKERGRLTDYLGFLPPAYHDTIIHNVAGVWLPIEVGLAHYRACDALKFTAQELHEIGLEVGHRMQGTFLGTLVRMAKAAGVTPWKGLSQTHKLWLRMFIGGGIEVVKLGPKEARMEAIGVPMAALHYFRTGFRSTVQAGVELFCAKAYLQELPKLCSASSLAIRIAWA